MWDTILIPNSLILSTQLIESPDLSDIFINPKFELSVIRDIFEEDAWTKIEISYQNKILSSTCSICNNICFQKSVLCEKIEQIGCNKWYQWKCTNVSQYVRSGKSKKPWLCLDCKKI